ncbi:MAG: SprT-like domain-containing protein [Pyrinomonadaceae bacterium]
MPIETEQLAEIYQMAFFSFSAAFEPPKAKVEFYPYVGANSRIRLRDGNLIVRISDVLIDAPLEFHKALAQILIRKLFRRRMLKSDLEIYHGFLKQPRVHEKSIAARRARGRKIVTAAKGEVYDLDNIFVFLNQFYFENSLPKPVLTWSAKKTFRILGHHDSTHETIAVSRSLDDKNIPRFVVEYVVYHEMLHIKHPTIHRNGRRYNHTPAFRRDEKIFAYFEEAENWIEQNAQNLKRKARRK